MNALHEERRSFLFGLAGLSITQLLPQSTANGQAAEPQVYVLGATEGEYLVHFRNCGNDLFRDEKRKGAIARPFPSFAKGNSCQAFSRCREKPATIKTI